MNIKVHTIPNYRQIKVTCLAPTNRLGVRVKIWEPKHGEDDGNKTVILPYNNALSDPRQQALNYLLSRGFNVVAQTSEQDYYVLLCNNLGEDFIGLK